MAESIWMDLVTCFRECIRSDSVNHIINCRPDVRAKEYEINI